jgi:integrase/recombinase XerD
MFNKLFICPVAVARHCEAPLVKERTAYLDYLASRGSSHGSLRLTASYLLVITDILRLEDLPARMVLGTDIEEAAKRWATRRVRSKQYKPGKCSERCFISIASRWLDYSQRLERQLHRTNRFESWLAEFEDYMCNERGLSAATLRGRCYVISRFLGKMAADGNSPDSVTITDVDAYLQLLGEKYHYSRASLQMVAGCLRAFFRYGATRGWCGKGIADAIKSPRVYSLASLPCGPAWEDVKRLLALTEDDSPANIRDRAIIMLLAIYGLRAGEVTRLRLEDFDWQGEFLSVRCSKTRKARVFPLIRSVGDAVLRYVRQVRPRTHHREVFLSLQAPIQPMQVLWPIVANRLRRLGVALPHHGPHALRHACATHLLAEGLSLKQIGDHLGHSDPDATRIYAKVDMANLRQVANMDLGELL